MSPCVACPTAPPEAGIAPKPTCPVHAGLTCVGSGAARVGSSCTAGLKELQQEDKHSHRPHHDAPSVIFEVEVMHQEAPWVCCSLPPMPPTIPRIVGLHVRTGELISAAASALDYMLCTQSTRVHPWRPPHHLPHPVLPRQPLLLGPALRRCCRRRWQHVWCSRGFS